MNELKNVYDESFNNYYSNNIMHIYLRKSNRKNAKISDCIMVHHLINKNKDEKLTDKRILQQFADTIAHIVYYSKQFNNHLELNSYAMINKQTSYVDANGDLYHTTEKLNYTNKRVKFSSIENCINYVYKMYCLVYPYNTINLNNTVYNNPLIKYHINNYYNNKEA